MQLSRCYSYLTITTGYANRLSHRLFDSPQLIQPTMVRVQKAVVLLSGGMDSATALAMTQKEGFDVIALTLDYGQRHRREIAAAKRVAAHFRVREHRVVSLDLTAIGGSALTDQRIPIPEGRPMQEIGRGIQVTYVPARNTIFLPTPSDSQRPPARRPSSSPQIFSIIPDTWTAARNSIERSKRSPASGPNAGSRDIRSRSGRPSSRCPKRTSSGPASRWGSRGPSRGPATTVGRKPAASATPASSASKASARPGSKIRSRTPGPQRRTLKWGPAHRLRRAGPDGRLRPKGAGAPPQRDVRLDPGREFSRRPPDRLRAPVRMQSAVRLVRLHVRGRGR